MKKFEGKTVVITGAGSGMGRASALLFAKEGANVVVADINKEPALETVDLIVSNGGNAIEAVCNVAIKDEVTAIIDRVYEKYGSIDVLFNNAGVGMPAIKTEEVSEELTNLIVDVNIKGVLWGSQAVIPYMKKQSTGVIINTASIMGVRTRPGHSIYSASKAAAIMLTKSLALELAEYGIRVVGINPVATETGMLKAFIGDQEYESGKGKFISSIPLGRVAAADDVAKAALYLASDDASMVTGSFIDIDGGRGV
ncbi:SDR family oxidoreductase [Alkalihalobacillus sp. MEB130]|uniref:SDR family NAD(P)-dependent oxidoreductase n=1 Tax=Alkalihalobacillus sp. MEB130 TaxID=2976704 RepID=UPI0028DF9398|nr:SDR family oxidoreductase [Alkalihalobacillus sp. MEB130]MDT8861004.1 SDR family oxidoreductase [Alkalihalobacillus sp. MEB130]